MEAERLKSLAEVERSVAVRQSIGVAFVTFDDASVASRFHACYTVSVFICTKYYHSTVASINARCWEVDCWRNG